MSHGNELNAMRDAAHQVAVESGWWTDLKTGERKERNKGELIALMHSELSECLEGVRKNLNDDKLPHHKMETVELVDVLIRIFDYAGAYNLPIGEAFDEKMAYNSKRLDHKLETRRAEGGKQF